MRASMLGMGFIALVLASGCKKSSDAATGAGGSGSQTTINVTGLNGQPATATVQDGLTRYSDEGPEIGTVFTKGGGVVRSAADQTSTILARLGPNVGVNKKARRGPYFLVDYPVGPGQLKPGWIDQAEVTGTPVVATTTTTLPPINTVAPPINTVAPPATTTAGHPPIRIPVKH